MKLYYAPGACSLAPHIVAREAGLALDIERVDLKNRTTESGQSFAAINPKGYVPALRLDNGEVLTEGPAIVQYIADLAPEKQLAPAAGTFERVRLQEVLNFISTELHKGFSPLFRKECPEEWKEVVRANLGRRFADLDAQLGARQFLLGDRFTIADGYLFTVLGWTRFVNYDLAPYPNLVAYQQRVAARPAVHAALEAEGLIKRSA